jgi:gamma-glutamyltranspeptidase/glutathione hydrolase
LWTILRAGGNAFDAVQWLPVSPPPMAEPALASLGGGGFLLARPQPKGGRSLFDFFVDTPGTRPARAGELGAAFFAGDGAVPQLVIRSSTLGWDRSAVPGVLRGYLHVHQSPRPAAFAGGAGARRFTAGARRGGDQRTSKVISWRSADADHDPERVRVGRCLQPDGRYLGAGDLLSQSGPGGASGGLALQTASGRSTRAIWPGAWFRRCSEGNGLLTAADLATYQVVEREPLPVDYRGYRLADQSAPLVRRLAAGAVVALAGSAAQRLNWALVRPIIWHCWWR